MCRWRWSHAYELRFCIPNKSRMWRYSTGSFLPFHFSVFIPTMHYTLYRRKKYSWDMAETRDQDYLHSLACLRGNVSFLVPLPCPLKRSIVGELMLRCAPSVARWAKLLDREGDESIEAVKDCPLDSLCSFRFSPLRQRSSVSPSRFQD